MRFFGGERKEAVMKEDYISITLRLPFFGFFTFCVTGGVDLFEKG